MTSSPHAALHGVTRPFAPPCVWQMFADVVLGLGKDQFEEVLVRVKADRGYKHDFEMTADDLEGIVDAFKGLVTVPQVGMRGGGERRRIR
jgi:hypothetical protein